MRPTEAQHAYVDRVAKFFSGLGAARAWAEILAWLMICEPAEQTQAEIAESLGLSSGSVSTQLRSLAAVELVETVRVRGDRVQRYRMRAGAWQRVLTSELERIHALGELAHLAAPVLPVERPERVTELARVAGFLEHEWPALMGRMTAHLEKGTP